MFLFSCVLAELKMEAAKEREMRETYEKQLEEEQKVKSKSINKCTGQWIMEWEDFRDGMRKESYIYRYMLL